MSKCKQCDTELDENNQYRFHIEHNINLCKICHKSNVRENYHRGNKTEEEKRQSKINRMVDEERVNRLFDRMKQSIIHLTQLDYIEKEKTKARMKHIPEEESQRIANDECKDWTFEQIVKENRQKPQHFLVMRDVLHRYEIKDEVEGDTGTTWHIAFNKHGYEEFELDGDGLPIQRPGVQRLALITRVRKKADKEVDMRLGIASVKCREIPRRPKTEWRICLCKKQETFDKIHNDKILRQAGDDLSESRLKASMLRDEDVSSNWIEAIAKLYSSRSSIGGA